MEIFTSTEAIVSQIGSIIINFPEAISTTLRSNYCVALDARISKYLYLDLILSIWRNSKFLANACVT